jgi:hypothetical protein
LAFSGCSPKPSLIRASQADNPALAPRALPAWHGLTCHDLTLFVIELREAQLASEADKAAARK